MCHDLNLALSLLTNGDIIAQVSNAAIDLYSIVKELFESGDIEDLVGGGLGGIDDVLT